MDLTEKKNENKKKREKEKLCKRLNWLTLSWKYLRAIKGFRGFPGGGSDKEDRRDAGLIPGLGRCPGGGQMEVIVSILHFRMMFLAIDSKKWSHN